MLATFEPKPIVLPYALHDYQQLFFGDALMRIGAPASPGDSFLYASPTGSGKSLMALALLAQDPHALLITPRLEIVAGMLEKLGEECSTWNDSRLAKEALAYRITTPVRLLNQLAAGTFPFHPERLIIDEVHHALADTYQKILAYLPGVVRIGLTATPYRGTPKSTAEFLREWGDQITWVLTLKQAAEHGIVEIPGVEIWPLVDDDEIRVTNGEIDARAAGDIVAPRLGEVVERCGSMVSYDAVSAYVRGTMSLEGQALPATWGRLWDRPTLFSVPTTDCVYDLVDRLNAAGIPAVGVTQDTPRADRMDAFRRVVTREVAIVQINVVSEGVDLPIRRLIDLAPTMSPVRWVQQLGRATRPRKRCRECVSLPTGERMICTCSPPSVYVCCNRNLERHGYLFSGLIPPSYIGAAQKAFPTPSTRAASRAIGLEGVGKFKAAELLLLDGTAATMFNVFSMAGFERTDYTVLLHPAVEEPLVASRVSTRDEGGSVTWGRWKRIDALPPDLRGFQSSAPSGVSEKQKAWWLRAAARHGLDPSATPNKKNFAALPVLVDTKAKLRVGGF